jgi:hypothetical protein
MNSSQPNFQPTICPKCGVTIEAVPGVLCPACAEAAGVMGSVDGLVAQTKALMVSAREATASEAAAAQAGRELVAALDALRASKVALRESFAALAETVLNPS